MEFYHFRDFLIDSSECTLIDTIPAITGNYQQRVQPQRQMKYSPITYFGRFLTGFVMYYPHIVVWPPQKPKM